MKVKYLLFLIVLFVSFVHSQTNNNFLEIDTKMSKIPDSLTYSTIKIASFIATNFNTDNERIRAVFYFTASKIAYDVDQFKAILNNTNNKTITTINERINNTLVSRKGVCQNYSEIFASIADNLQIKTFVVEGYTKQLGKIDNFSHAWCASKIDNKWYIFDPTWGSGFINNFVYTRKINNKYYKMSPEKSIADHMPFDYLWQFSNNPITNQAFYDNKIEIDKSRKNYDFEAEIKSFEELNNIEKNKQIAYRIEQNGLKNNMILESLKYYKTTEDNYTSKDNFDKINEINQNLSIAINEFNNFISFRNKQFKPTISDENLKLLIENPRIKLLACENQLSKIGVVDPNNVSNIKGLKKTLNEVSEQVEFQYQFVNLYLTKNLIGRKLMFTKAFGPKN